LIAWLIGLSGAGKTTIGRHVFDQLKPSCPNLVFLDGDILRDVWGDSLGHTIEARAVNAHRISHLCRMLDRQGIHAIAAVLSMFPDWQVWNRENFSNYYEIFLDASWPLLNQRDNKDLYRAARAGEIDNVVGVDLEFPRPVNPDLVLGDDVLKRPPMEIADILCATLNPLLSDGQQP
jgi:adenylylsulfate kinase-like enzyme